MNIGTLIPLPFETRAQLQFSHILRLTAADLAQLTSGTAQAVVPNNALGGANTIPAGTVVTKAVANVVTAFTSSGGAITTLTLSLGDGGSATRFVNAVDLKTAGWSTTVVGAAYNYAVADTIDATPTIVGQTMASINAGQVDIYLALHDISGFPNVVEPSAT